MISMYLDLIVSESFLRKITGNNYGLTEVIGKDNIWPVNKLSSQFQFAADNTWHSSGADKYSSTWTSENV